MTDADEYRYLVECEFIAACCKYPSLYHVLRKSEKYVISMGDMVAQRLRKRLGTEPSLDRVARELAGQ